MADKDDIEYFFLKEDDFEEVAAFLKEDFFQREPTTLGTSANDKCEPSKGRMGEDLRRCLKSGLSVAARDRKTGKMVGARVSVFADRAKPHTPTQPPNELEELYRVLDFVMGQAFNEKADKFLLMFLLSVHKDYGSRGIAGKMVKMCMEAGYAQGAEIACTCITNVLSGKVFLKLGYETRYTLDYEKPNHGYKVDLSKMYGNKTVRLMVKALP
ncbi:uncharacterized protein LOC122243411 [Penaeus japonicus]|uniref:uncharacterized protein LOC122243411 n=1 Tax=Penaeus japonicus TaxID=27405 RepID=UPI001C7132C4|nr:uncharacterized protein LOC122243411 [Penaeus japonicus]